MVSRKWLYIIQCGMWPIVVAHYYCAKIFHWGKIWHQNIFMSLLFLNMYQFYIVNHTFWRSEASKMGGDVLYTLYQLDVWGFSFKFTVNCATGKGLVTRGFHWRGLRYCIRSVWYWKFIMLLKYKRNNFLLINIIWRQRNSRTMIPSFGRNVWSCSCQFRSIPAIPAS